jgi:eukaryotic-like serine/threonine-protein kinase
MPESMPSVIGGRYRVLDELGRGGMGVVYRVEHLHTGERLALKVLLAQAGARADIVERFRREARTPALVQSEHVVKVTDADVAPELGGALFLVMELLNGCDLERRLRQRGLMSPPELCQALAQVGEALDRAHRQGIVHRDLKPENLFEHHRPDGSVVIKVLDFGIAKFAYPMGDGEPRLTSTGAIMGTPSYMSPEQARGDVSLIGPPTDVWALGQIAFRCLGGKDYWPGPSVGEVVAQILTSPLTPPSQALPGLPPAFDQWFFRSCAREPGARWPSCGEQVAALAAAFGLAGASAGAVAGAGASAGALTDRLALGAVKPSTPPAWGAQPSPLTVPGAPVQTPWPAAPVQTPWPAAPGPVTAQGATGAAGSRLGLWLGIGAALLFVAGVSVSLTVVLHKGGGSARDSAVASAEPEPSAAARPGATGSSEAAKGRGSGDAEGHVEAALMLGAPKHYPHEQLVKAIDPALPSVLECCRAELRSRPGPGGKLDVSLMLERAGNISTATCMPEPGGSLTMTMCECVRAASLRWHFPERKTADQWVTVTYQLGCTP